MKRPGMFGSKYRVLVRARRDRAPRPRARARTLLGRSRAQKPRAIALLVCLAGVAAGFGLHAYAQDASSDQPLFYSGSVASDDGSPLDGAHGVRVRLFAAETGGSALCETPQLNAPFSLGRFRIELPAGSGGCAEAVARNAAWTEVSVDGNTFPRARVGAVPFAVQAKHASSADLLVGEQAQTLERLKSKVDSAAPSTPTTPAPSAKPLSYRFISKDTGECTYGANTNATTCMCKPGEVILSGGAWAGPGGTLNATRIWNTPGDGVGDAERGLGWTVSCIDAAGAARECQFVQALCLKATL